MQRLLGAATRTAASPTMRGIAYWLARAFRRMAKIVGTVSLILVRDILRLADACPASPLILPDRTLSKTARARLKPLENGLKIYSHRVVRMGGTRRPTRLRWLRRASRPRGAASAPFAPAGTKCGWAFAATGTRGG